MGLQVTSKCVLTGLTFALVSPTAACSSNDEPEVSDAAAGQGGAAGAGGAAGTGGASGGAHENGVDADTDGAEPIADEDAEPDAEPTTERDVFVPCGASTERCCGLGKTCNDGLSCSDQFCLACGPAPAPREGCVNVATAATTSAQQTYPANPLSALNDNDVCVAWGSGDYPDVAGSDQPGTWFQLDLLESKTLDAMSFWVKQTPSDAEVSLLFAYSSDGDTWMAWPSAAGVSKRLHDSAPWVETFVPAITARYFKVTFVNSPSFVSMRELGLYSCPEP